MMRIFRRISLAVLLLFHVANGFSSELTLSEVLTSVERHYPLVVSSYQEQVKAQGELLSAQGGFDPVLKSTYRATPSGEFENRYFDTLIEQPTPVWGTKAYVGYRNGQGLFGPYDEDLITSQSGQVRAGIEVPILRGGFIDDRRAKIASQQKSLEASTKSVELQKIDSKKQATYRYFEWIAAGQKVQVSRGLLELARTRDEILAHRVQKGDAAKIERTDNQRSVLQREAALIASRRGFEKSSLDLSLFYRDEHGQPMLPLYERLPVQGLPHPDLGSEGEVLAGVQSGIQAEALQEQLQNLPADWTLQHPEVLKFQAQIQQNDVEQRLARNFIYPKLDVSFSVSQNLGAGNTALGMTEYKAGLKLEFPILFRAGAGRIDAALANGIKLETQLSFAKDRLKTALSDSFQAIAAAKKRIVLTEREVLLSGQVEDAERTKLKHGDSNVLLVNLREQSTADARTRSIEALTDYHRARADLEAVTAGLFKLAK